MKLQSTSRMSRISGSILTWGIVALAVYILLLGPLVLAASHGRIPESVLEVIYAPLYYLPESPMIQVPLNGYVDLWIGPGDCGGTGDGG